MSQHVSNKLNLKGSKEDLEELINLYGVVSGDKKGNPKIKKFPVPKFIHMYPDNLKCGDLKEWEKENWGSEYIYGSGKKIKKDNNFSYQTWISSNTNTLPLVIKMSKRFSEVIFIYEWYGFPDHTGIAIVRGGEVEVFYEGVYATIICSNDVVDYINDLIFKEEE